MKSINYLFLGVAMCIIGILIAFVFNNFEHALACEVFAIITLIYSITRIKHDKNG